MRILPVLLAATLLLPASAMAQGRLGGASGLRPTEPAAAPPRPQGLPGLQSRPTEVIPAQTPPSSMNPTDALFDAVSRGDVPAAREAVNRGADTNRRNALGLTAIDSAVDQARPAMIFYLLSLRGSAGSAPPPPGANAPAPRGRAGRPEPTLQAGPAPAFQPPAAPRMARLWANDGGAPQPENGFLGFDAGRTAGATATPARLPGGPQETPAPRRTARG